MITCKWLGWCELGQSDGAGAGQDGGKGLNTQITEVGARRGTERAKKVKSASLFGATPWPGGAGLIPGGPGS